MADNWLEIDRYLRSLGIRFGAPTPGQTTGGVHAPGSWHYAGQARDYGDASSDLPAILNALRPHAETGVLVELFGLTDFWKDGRRITPPAGLKASHQDHVHAALLPGALLPGPEEAPPVFDDIALPNITGPVSFHPIFNDQGSCTGYYIFSTATGEVHGHGPGAPYHGRSEVIAPR